MEKDKFEYETPALEPMTEKVTAVQGATGVDPDPEHPGIDCRRYEKQGGPVPFFAEPRRFFLMGK